MTNWQLHGSCSPVALTPPEWRYTGPSSRYVTLELDVGSDAFMNAVIEGVEVPECSMRWIALWSIRAAFDRAYTGERKEKQLARMDAAIDAVDCRIEIEADVSVNEDGEAEEVSNVLLTWQLVHGDGKWNGHSIKEPGQWLCEWICGKATEEIQKS